MSNFNRSDVERVAQEVIDRVPEDWRWEVARELAHLVATEPLLTIDAYDVLEKVGEAIDDGATETVEDLLERCNQENPDLPADMDELTFGTLIAQLREVHPATDPWWCQFFSNIQPPDSVWEWLDSERYSCLAEGVLLFQKEQQETTNDPRTQA